jgi:tetratricopeptide (TPR) repeat protein
MIYSHGAAACYRNDMKGRQRADSFGAHDGTWIEIASLLEHAAHLDDDAAAILTHDAVELAKTVVRDTGSSTYSGPLTDAGRERGGVEWIQLLTQELDEAGANTLAMLLLESLTAAHRSMSTVELGRIIAQQARMTWRNGGIERARILYRRVRRMARESGEIELNIRARLGFASLAHVERDFAAARRLATECARLADQHGYPALSRIAHNSLMVAAATAERYSDALLHAGRLFELAGDNPVALSELLVNVGQLLYSAGHPEAARAAFTTVLSKTQPAHVGLHALGGFALTSSALGEKSAVMWTFAELQKEIPRVNSPLAAASAWCECATALLSIGEIDNAIIAKHSALEMASRHGFRALVEKAEAIEVNLRPAPPAPCVLTPNASNVARRIQLQQPASFPLRVSLIAAA